MGEFKTIRELEIKLFLQPLSNLVARLSYIRRLERAWQLIERDYMDTNLTLERAAAESGVSKNHLNVLFRQMTTFTFHQLLIRYRLFKAATMIISKNFSLIEVAFQNGFGSLNAFERNFRSLIGVTPREFKSNNDLCGMNRDFR